MPDEHAECGPPYEVLSRAGAPDLAYRWLPACGASATLLFVHGFGEHSGRYEEVWAALAEFDRLAFDLRGHGRSGGRRGHVRRFEDYHDDLSEMLTVADERGHGPIVLVAHSFGGLIAADFVGTRPAAASRLAGLVLSSPGLAFRYVPPRWERMMAQVMTHLVPTISRPARLDASRLSHDPAVEAAVRSDPLNYAAATVRWYTESLQAQSRALAAASNVFLPVLGLLAGEDALVLPEVSREYFAGLGGADVTLREYPRAYHELFQEENRAEILTLVRDWCRERVGGMPELGNE